MKIFFQTNEGTLPFDVFSASFYLISRYEEYLPYTPDKHGRFQPKDSLAYKNGFLEIPLVNVWAEKLKSVLLKTYAELNVKENLYSFVPTIDVDVAYAHKGRRLYITLGAYAKALTKFDFPFVINKTAVLLGLKDDDYDTYEYIHTKFRENGISPIYFVLAGERGKYDKNISTQSPRFKGLVKKLGFRGNVGVHPSYQSMNDLQKVNKERDLVERGFRGKITKSRQHYLRINFPETFRCLVGAGITDEYSMGYAAMPGFRASTCIPYSFYDIEAERTLPIKLHSSVVMDGTLNEYICVSPGEAIELTRKLFEQVRKYKGEFIAIWHNDTLNDKGKWKGWRKVFETVLQEAK